MFNQQYKNIGAPVRDNMKPSNWPVEECLTLNQHDHSSDYDHTKGDDLGYGEHHPHTVS